jgi:predicted molibdopterin-dependent oxidoreductase YjgC
MLISNEEYLELFEGATSDEKSELIDDMSIEEAELLHDNGYKVYLNNGEVVRVVSKDGNTTWYATDCKNN